MDGAADSRCPRCGGAFHCGAAEPQPCACGSLTLESGMLAALRAQYQGCLCLACLRTLAAAAPLAIHKTQKKAGPV